ncbi:(d)CMP kinase [Paenibacillus sp. 481]|uniref:(d)CMP kinase n=1 Tax=Paenibacillus sp. 481 TaxID=2835869 RepID=UPI003FA71DF8
MTSPSKVMTTRMNIAIDGPAGAGKSTVARHVARELGYVYIDTGAMYRAVSLHMIRTGIQPDQVEEAVAEMQRLHLELLPGSERQTVLLNKEDVTETIRTPEISQFASLFAQLEPIRIKLVHMQRQMAEQKGIVMDGRDIGTHVLPDAEFKWFLTASVEERARRRYVEYMDKENVTLEQLMHDIEQRDRQDETREISPLRLADDAILLDTSSMSIDEVVNVIVQRAILRKDGEQ